MQEIEIVGRGGMGVVTAGELLAYAAFKEGKHVQAFPMFGAERRGAPVHAYVRIDEKPIKLRCMVTRPNIIIALDARLVNEEVLERVKGGMLIVNAKEEIKARGTKVIKVDATSIATEIFGKPLVNTAMLGAAAAVGIVKYRHLAEAIEERFEGKIAELNKKAMSAVYEKVRKELLK